MVKFGGDVRSQRINRYTVVSAPAGNFTFNTSAGVATSATWDSFAELVLGDKTRAEAAFREAIRIQPDYADAHNNLGNLLAGTGDFQQARYHFEASLRIRPGDARTRYKFAMALRRVRQFDEAQRQLEDSLRADPELADARLVLAQMLVAKGQTQAAIPHLQKASAAQDPAVRQAAVEMLRRLGNGR